MKAGVERQDKGAVMGKQRVKEVGLPYFLE